MESGVEHPFLRVPFERLSQQFRSTQKLVSKEVQKVVGEIRSLSADSTLTKEVASEQLLALQHRLERLKQKLLESKKNEEGFIRIFQKRVAHLQEDSGAAVFDKWSAIRLDRLLVDCLLRQGHFKTCKQLVEQTGISDLVDIDVFSAAHSISEALRQQNVQPALRWCTENGPKLRRLEHPIEFQLRLQEFIGLVRADQKNEALIHAQKYLSPMAADHMQEVQQAMATLAFADPQKSDIREYQQLFAPGRWDELFLQANEQVYSCGEQAPVLYALLAGLSVLKTPCCSDPSQRNPNCPVCSVAGHKLADSLPFGHHSQSHLVCRISGEVMDDNNPPLALPNGEVYSQSALQAQAVVDGGYVSCPRTGERFRLGEARTAYII